VSPHADPGKQTVSVSEPIIVITHLPPLARPARWTGCWNGLTAALLLIAIVGGGYALWFWPDFPAPNSAIGLGLGITGFLFMLGAETLYSIRKRARRFCYGQMSAWLQAHIFLGLAGAFFILLHSAGKFHGLAGATMLVLLIMIVSGLVGRFIYTAAPRTLDGIEIDARELLNRFAEAERRWQALGIKLSPYDLAELSVSPSLAGWAAVLGRSWLLWRQRQRVRRYVCRLPAAIRATALELPRLLVDRYELQLDIRSVAATRHWLSWWHVLPVPLGLVLFTLATIHIAVALRFTLG